ncbi:MAG: hypothetical protein O7C58_04155, partial [Rickettsia endosymbiont of Ixodes persulcatus]|nr:hypothetical protein [Rickettsia endosymbiont of Ixodes persulcatus]
VQKHHSQKITKPKAARLVHTSHDLDTTGFIDQANNTDNIVHNNQSLLNYRKGQENYSCLLLDVLMI